MHRLLSAAPFILKGGGWYVTDYPSEARKKGLSAEKSSSATSETKSESKSESKPNRVRIEVGQAGRCAHEVRLRRH